MNNIKLVVGDLSTWSIRAWISLKLAEVEFSEVVMPLGNPKYKGQLSELSDSKLVPVLVRGSARIHDSMAIAEYVNELADGKLYLRDQLDRAACRSLCAELHSGFTNIRTLCPYSINGGEVISSGGVLEPYLNRLKQIWSKASGQFYYKDASLFDAYYAIMAHRLAGYDIYFEGAAGDYQRNVLSWGLFAESLQRAKHWSTINS
jgi:glutathione S-transferase